VLCRRLPDADARSISANSISLCCLRRRLFLRERCPFESENDDICTFCCSASHSSSITNMKTIKIKRQEAISKLKENDNTITRQHKTIKDYRQDKTTQDSIRQHNTT
jgi:hypothetical protein